MKKNAERVMLKSFTFLIQNLQVAASLEMFFKSFKDVIEK